MSTKPAFKKLSNAAAAAQFKEDAVHLRARVEVLERQIKTYQKAKGFAREFIDQLATAVQAYEPPRIVYRKPKKLVSSPIDYVIQLGDLHVGEVIQADETEGFGAFNWTIAQARMDQLAEYVINYISTQRNGYYIPRLTVVGGGDYISGDIHDELKITNEFPLPVQTANAGHLIGSFLTKLSPHFEAVVFEGVGADNHSRLVRKPQAKQKALNSMSFLVHEIAELATKKLPNLDFRRARGMKQLVRIANHNFLTMHGDTIKAVMGIPFYGFEREVGREAIRRMGSEERAFDYILMYHWHVANKIGKVLVNGALPGTSEYDHSAGRFALPSQVGFLVHPKHGMFNWTPWKLLAGLDGKLRG